MSNEELQQQIAAWEPAAEFTEEGSQFLNVIIEPPQLRALAEKLRHEEATFFDYMFCLTCVDYPEHFMMVYHLRSTRHGHEMVLKVRITDKEKPAVDTLCDIWRTAEWHEREVYDLFGIHFNNHPDLRRLLLDDDWKGYPLRKDYVDPVNMISY
ncbi:MAG TPA: NADH-quinone oxidoreductase subunit C [Flammeovirgaceae bacterium]|nr:NADH-quinone oxidoreductase subunit C [Flammeovirgaceae bacterium]